MDRIMYIKILNDVMSLQKQTKKLGQEAYLGTYRASTVRISNILSYRF